MQVPIPVRAPGTGRSTTTSNAVATPLLSTARPRAGTVGPRRSSRPLMTATEPGHWETASEELSEAGGGTAVEATREALGCNGFGTTAAAGRQFGGGGMRPPVR